jgi:Predicted nucleic acid-binding protein, contains PIN domain
MNICLLDTGPLVALLDRSEPDHDQVQSFMARLRGSRLFTTGAVITEAFYFLSDVRDGPGQPGFISRRQRDRSTGCF